MPKYSVHTNQNFKLQEENDCLNGVIDGKLSSIEQKYQRDITDFQCPSNENNQLGVSVCNNDHQIYVQNGINEQQNDINEQQNGINEHQNAINEQQNIINDEQTNQINQNSQDISNVADGSSPKIAELIRKIDILSTCENSAEHDLGLGSSKYTGRYVGNCNTGDVFTPSGCSFQCQDRMGGWVTCASVECGSRRWTLTSGSICCMRNSNPYIAGCCS